MPLELNGDGTIDGLLDGEWTSSLAGKVATSALEGYAGMSSTALDVFPRWACGFTITASSGTVRLTYFTPTRDMTVSSIAYTSGATVASSVTLVRFGLFTVSGDDVTLVARTASDTTIFNTNYATYTRSFNTTGGYPATYDLVAGTRYAVGFLIVHTGTSPVIAGGAAAAPTSVAPFASAPRLTGAITGQTDLPTAATTVVGSSTLPFARLA